MKRIAKFLWLTLLVAGIATASKADQIHGMKPSRPVNTKAAGCASATAQIDLDINNVRALIMNGGDMWWDRGLQVARYEVPKIDPPGSAQSVSSLFAASIWVGGIDNAGNLRVAAQTYRQGGNDYYPGPLDATGTVDQQTCTNYDRFWKLNLTDIQTYKALGSKTVSNIPKAILEWPAKGNPYAVGTNSTSLVINDQLAPFFDVDNDQNYDPLSGDYPAFDPTDTTVMPDQMIWWVYNDKGNIHTETTADPIGLQVNATAFAYSTNDDINNMTFYRYDLFNKGNYTLDSAFIAQWVDPDLGCANDDYIGCDTSGTAMGSGTGLGICYNADAFDEACPAGYLSNVPMVGIDFFQGPKNAQGKVLGMTGFYYYYNTTPSTQADPQNAVQFYGYMTGTWRDGTAFTYGGNAHLGASTTSFVYADAPNLTGTKPGSGLPYWSMCNPTVTPGDLRVVESSGPFQLIPGAKQTVTVGVVWVRPIQYPCPSFAAILNADRKAQGLFDANFRILNGPDAPDMSVKEYDKQLVITLSNPASSNNYGEKYMEFDNTILPYVAANPAAPTRQDTLDASYRFEGYQIFQLKDNTVSAAELHDMSKAREIAQVDIKNGITKIVNFTKDLNMNANVPTLEVSGSDQGIKHSFVVNTDAFATGNTDLINHKTYYYMVIAYSHNNYKQFSDADPTSQDDPYKPSRRRVRVYSAIPHIVDPEMGGTVLNSKYGDQPIITRIEGYGNGGNFLNLSQTSIDKIMKDNFAERLVYDTLGGPVNVMVTDPKNVKPYKFNLYLIDSVETPIVPNKKDSLIATAYWKLVNTSTGEVRYSETDMQLANEQIFDDWGFSVNVRQIAYAGTKFSTGSGSFVNMAEKNGFIGSEVKFDVTKIWYGGVPDQDGDNEMNWIRSGTYKSSASASWSDYDMASSNPVDKDADYEKVVDGTWAPYRLCAHQNAFPTSGADLSAAILPAFDATSVNSNAHKLNNLPSVDIVLTSDKSKWTRCVVVETDPDPVRVGFTNGLKLQARSHDSWVSPNDLNADGSPKYTAKSVEHPAGLSWFPGYAINLETGERLDIMFGEDSWLLSDNGNDMLWNPTATMFGKTGEAKYGGRHYIYVMNHRYAYNGDDQDGNPATNSPVAYLTSLTSGNANIIRTVYEDAQWVNVPLAISSFGVNLKSAREGIIPSDVTVKLRVAKPYGKFTTMLNDEHPNYPLYSFDMGDLAAKRNDTAQGKSALDLVNVVPNPYYAYSNYETSQIDTRVKITNLPPKCTVTIYSVDGTMIRQYKRDNDSETFLDWDLKNNANIPVSSGLYLIHISAQGLGDKGDAPAQRVIKWFGVMRPIDLNTF